MRARQRRPGAFPARTRHRCEISAFSQDGTRLAIGSADGTARIWNPATGQQITGPRHGRAVRDMAFNPAASAVRAVAFSPDGTRLATGSADNAARIWAI